MKTVMVFAIALILIGGFLTFFTDTLVGMFLGPVLILMGLVGIPVALIEMAVGA